MRTTMHAFRLGAGACASAALLAILAGCGGSSIPDTDRVFLSAAGNWDRNEDPTRTAHRRLSLFGWAKHRDAPKNFHNKWANCGRKSATSRPTLFPAL